MCTAASAYSSAHTELHVCHSSSVMLTRSVFILSLVSRPSFSIENENDADYLWDVMYNQIWSRETKQRFIKDVKELVTETGNVKCSMATVEQQAVKSAVAKWLKVLNNKSVNSFLQDRYMY